MSFLRLSKWTYNTGAGGGLSVEIVMATGGTIILTDPEKHDQSFYYGGVGVGIGAGLKIPKIKLPRFSTPEIKLPPIRGRSVGAAGSTLDFPSYGSIYMTSAFRGTELSRSDFQGGTIYVDGSLSALYGWAGDAMLLGMNPALLAAGLSGPGFSWLLQRAISEAPAVLIMRGQTVGFQAGASIGILAGYVH
ncbi:hypothetical protein [Burkholderia thailandensis]|uniref:hypothetical protein n=1 Tax=Burkholderia thailandensis TaxID=57975 RepID=UPI00075776A0|nr:hypothetical protein [Burkholderia thailandensis]KVG13257.1 hypothetical protein WJ25_04455 [Burkholderia thailandensis]